MPGLRHTATRAHSIAMIADRISAMCAIFTIVVPLRAPGRCRSGRPAPPRRTPVPAPRAGRGRAARESSSSPSSTANRSTCTTPTPSRPGSHRCGSAARDVNGLDHRHARDDRIVGEHHAGLRDREHQPRDRDRPAAKRCFPVGGDRVAGGPVSDPARPAVIAIHDALLVAVHAHVPADAVTFTLPPPPARTRRRARRRQPESARRRRSRRSTRSWSPS